MILKLKEKLFIDFYKILEKFYKNVKKISLDKIKKLIIFFILLNLVLNTSLISKAKNENPSILVNSIHIQQSSKHELENRNISLGPTQIYVNRVYFIKINYSLIFPQNTTEILLFPLNTSVASLNTNGCGFDASLVVVNWEIINTNDNCPFHKPSLVKISAGTYNLSMQFYLINLINISKFLPKTIGFYISPRFDIPVYRSIDYYFNLSNNQTYFYQPIKNTNIISDFVKILFIISGIIILSLAIYLIVNYRSYIKEKKIYHQSFRNYLKHKIQKKKRNKYSKLDEGTIQKLEAIIDEIQNEL